MFKKAICDFGKDVWQMTMVGLLVLLILKISVSKEKRRFQKVGKYFNTEA